MTAQRTPSRHRRAGYAPLVRRALYAGVLAPALMVSGSVGVSAATGGDGPSPPSRPDSGTPASYPDGRSALGGVGPITRLDKRTLIAYGYFALVAEARRYFVVSVNVKGAFSFGRLTRKYWRVFCLRKNELATIRRHIRDIHEVGPTRRGRATDGTFTQDLRTRRGSVTLEHVNFADEPDPPAPPVEALLNELHRLLRERRTDSVVRRQNDGKRKLKCERTDS